MNKLIIIALLALCAECAWANNFDMGTSALTASGDTSPGFATRKDARREAPTKSQQIAQLWHIQPDEIDKPINLWGKP